MAEDFVLQGGVDLNEAEARQQADRLAEIFAGAFKRAAPSIGRDLANQINVAFSRNSSRGSDFGDQFADQARKIRNEARFAADSAGQMSDAFSEAGRAGSAAFRRINVDELNADIAALTRRVEASKTTLQDLGANPNLFAVIDRELANVLKTARTFNDNLEEISRDPRLFEGYSESLKQSRRVISGELDAALRLLINFKEDQRQVATQLQRQEDNSTRLRVANIKQASSAFVVAEQGANAQRLAETRISGQRQIQQERIAARTRIEIVRFTFRQIQILERGIAGVFRATGTVAQSAARTTQAAVARIGNLFRRSNRDLNDGLGGALVARERSIDRSFERQTSQIRGSLREQSVLIDRFERQASTGLVGAATGRSGIGRLFGVGAGIGGGFLIARQLREGFEESVNLTESLNAVRQIAGDAADEIIRFSEDSVEALFLTQSAALEAGVGFASFGKSAGLGGEQLATFSNTLTQLATDLASFRNTSVEQAIQSLTSALAGEAEPIRRNYSVLLNEATLQQRAFTLGITDTIRKLEPQERVLAAYAEILAQTTDAQGDAARTAEDFANAAKEASAGITELFSAIVGGLKPIGTSFLNVFNPAIARLTELIEGGLSDRLKILRDALIGVGIALAGLLVAKAAGEALQFFAIGLRAAITPLGLLVVGVAAAGAAIAVFSQRSERFADILRGVVSGLRNLAGRGVDLALQGLSALGRLVTDIVLPALQTLGQVIAGPVLRGLEIAIGFIVNVAVPAFTELAMLLVDNIVPALRSVGGFLTGTVVPALSAFGQVAIGVLSSVVSFLDPAIRGFEALGDAIVLAFRTGDLSGLLGGLQAVAVGIGQVFGNLGMLIFDALRPQVERAVGFISSAFDRIDFAAIGLRILEIVRLVGFVLGSIVSDPRFLTAVAAVAAAAIAVGVKFVQGFAQGVISNLPELGRLIGSALQRVVEEAISFAFSNPATIGKIILAALAAQAILSAYSAAGSRGARALSAGFIGGLRRTPGAARDVANGLFGGQGRLNDAVTRNARLAAEQTQRVFARTLRDVGRLGGNTSALFPNGIISNADVRRAQTQLRALETSIGQTQASARLFRQRTTEAFGGIRTAIGQTARALTPGLTGSFVRARAGASQALTAIIDGFARAQAQGKLSGAALGNAVLAGFGSAISGQQLGQGNTAIGLAGILSSSLAAGFATGLPVVGAAVGVVGLATAAITASGEEARIAAEKIAGYVQSFEGLSQGEILLEASRQITEALAAEGEGVRDLLIAADFTTAGFTQAAIDGTADIETVAAQLGAGLDLTSGQVQRFLDLRNDIEASGGGFGDRIQNFFSADEVDIAGITALREEFRKAGVDLDAFDDVLGALFDESGAIQESLEQLDFRSAINDAGLDDLQRQGVEKFTEDILALNQAQDATVESAVRLGQTDPYVRLAQGAADANEGVGGLLGDIGAGIRAIYEQAALPLDFNIEAAVDDLLSLLDLGGLVEDQFKGFGIDAFTDEYIGAGLSIADINRDIAESTQAATQETDFYAQALDALLGVQSEATAEAKEQAAALDLTKAAISELNDQRTGRIRGEIERLRSQLDDAREAADLARDALTSFITSRYADTAQASVDALIGNIGNIGSEIEDALLQGGVRGEAALRSAVGGFEQQLAGIIQAGFDDGLRTQEEFRRLLAPLFAALDDEVGDSAGRILSTTDFEFGITDRAGSSLRDSLNRALAGRQIEVGARTLINAEAEVSRLEDLLNAQQAQLDVDVVFDSNQIREALRAAGATAAQLEGVNPASVTAAQQTGLVAAVQNGRVVTGANAGNFEIIVEPPPGNVEINVSGSDDPVRTAAEVTRQQRAATTGRIRVPV